MGAGFPLVKPCSSTGNNCAPREVACECITEAEQKEWNAAEGRTVLLVHLPLLGVFACAGWVVRTAVQAGQQDSEDTSTQTGSGSEPAASSRRFALTSFLNCLVRTGVGAMFDAKGIRGNYSNKTRAFS